MVMIGSLSPCSSPFTSAKQRFLLLTQVLQKFASAIWLGGLWCDPHLGKLIKLLKCRKWESWDIYIYMGICDYHDIIWYNNSLIIWLRNSYLNSLERVREHPWIHGFLSSLSRQVSPPLHLENCPKTGQWPWKGDGETNRETHPRWSGTMWHHLTDPTISPKAPGRHSTCARARINDLDSSTEI
jgi:hypothetical protein